MQNLQPAGVDARWIVILDPLNSEDRRRLLQQLDVECIKCRTVELPDGFDPPGAAPTSLSEFLHEFGVRLQTLNERERRVLQCVLAGMTNKSISRALDVSMRTIDLRKASLMKKLCVETQTELVRQVTMFETLTRFVFLRSDLPSDAESLMPPPFAAEASNGSRIEAPLPVGRDFRL